MIKKSFFFFGQIGAIMTVHMYCCVRRANEQFIFKEQVDVKETEQLTSGPMTVPFLIMGVIYLPWPFFRVRNLNPLN